MSGKNVAYKIGKRTTSLAFRRIIRFCYFFYSKKLKIMKLKMISGFEVLLF